MPLQSHLSSLTLVRLLQEWGPAPSEAPRQDAAERLGEWLSPFDSVKLDGALQAISSYGNSRQANARQANSGQPGPAVDGAALEALCARVKADLTASITTKLVPTSGPFSVSSASRDNVPTDAMQEEADYGKHLQRYAELQKQMDGKLSACRAHVRQALSKGSPRLRQLAALDGVMAEMLGEREQKLLAAVPLYLERRFAHWRQMHQDKRAVMAASGVSEADGEGDEAAAADDPQRWLQPGGWLHHFQQDMRQMLQAELQARLQPVLGLIEAVQAENR